MFGRGRGRRHGREVQLMEGRKPERERGYNGRSVNNSIPFISLPSLPLLPHLLPLPSPPPFLIRSPSHLSPSTHLLHPFPSSLPSLPPSLLLPLLSFLFSTLSLIFLRLSPLLQAFDRSWRNHALKRSPDLRINFGLQNLFNKVPELPHVMVKRSQIAIFSLRARKMMVDRRSPIGFRFGRTKKKRDGEHPRVVSVMALSLS